MIDSSIKHSDNEVRLQMQQSSLSKVKDYVQTLPSPRTISDWKHSLSDESRLQNTVLDESFDSEASSRSKMSSRQSDALQGNRYNNSGTGMFLGSALGTQTVCPFPSDWQFQTIPESIENSAEID